jgi:hypothetical protein
VFIFRRAVELAGLYAVQRHKSRSKNRRQVLTKILVLGSLVMAIAVGGIDVSARAQRSETSVAANVELPDAPGLGSGLDESELEKPAAAIETGTAIISGTVLDTNGDVIQGARVVLTTKAGTDRREVESGTNGEFTFSALSPGSYRVTVTGKGMGVWISPWLPMRAGDNRIVSQAVLPIAAATTSVTVSGDREELAEEQVQIAVEQRVLGVFPNFYSTYDWNAPPLGAKQKFKLALRSQIDPVTFAGAGGLAGFQQFYNIFPGYGRGVQGYAKRYAAAYTNSFSARMLSSAVFASLFRQDPRYFYKGTGTIRSRTFYAMSAAVIARNDDGRWRPNYSHVLGTFAAGALSNLYYPSASRGLSLTLVNGLVETAGNAGTNILREFVLKGITAHAGGKP